MSRNSALLSLPSLSTSACLKMLSCCSAEKARRPAQSSGSRPRRKAPKASAETSSWLWSLRNSRTKNSSRESLAFCRYSVRASTAILERLAAMKPLPPSASGAAASVAFSISASRFGITSAACDSSSFAAMRCSCSDAPSLAFVRSCCAASRRADNLTTSALSNWTLLSRILSTKNCLELSMASTADSAASPKLLQASLAACGANSPAANCSAAKTVR
mmetsp:Transcript_31648/g.56830  ORF Transcript_31648/g.56830 Transcript_31648/m.56830 type:complete len:218 (-) Transcript_31648:2899-3552(-)